MRGYKGEDLWSQLSSELWGLVLTHLQTLLDCNMNIFEDRHQVVHQNSLHAVRLVCNKLNLAFQEQSALFEDLLLAASWRSSTFPSLMLWLQHHGSLVCRLGLQRGAPTDAVLTGLILQKACLVNINLQEFSSSTLSLLSMCASIQECKPAVWTKQ